MTLPADFTFIDEAVPDVRWDAKYATWDNFTGRPVDGYQANRILGTLALCAGLRRARDEAESHGLGILVWDGYRPQRAVDRFLRWSAEPEDGTTKGRHYPRISKAEMFRRGYVATRSGHSRGSTVDLTLFDLATGELLDMGGGHDLMDEISHHGAPGTTRTVKQNRRVLRSIMEDSGFTPYAVEWWHYTLTDEPYPDTYFDFPVTSGGGSTPPVDGPARSVTAQSLARTSRVVVSAAASSSMVASEPGCERYLAR